MHINLQYISCKFKRYRICLYSPLSWFLIILPYIVLISNAYKLSLLCTVILVHFSFFSCWFLFPPLWSMQHALMNPVSRELRLKHGRYCKTKKQFMLHVHSIWNNQRDEMEITLKFNVMIHVWNIFLDFEITKTDKNTMWEGCESKHYKGIFTINL